MVQMMILKGNASASAVLSQTDCMPYGSRGLCSYIFGPRRFHENIMSQSCDTQFAWFQQQLTEAPTDDWVIVVGHHPASEIDVHDFVAPMEARGVSLYLNGHAHTMTHYTVNGKVRAPMSSTKTTHDQQTNWLVDGLCYYWCRSNGKTGADDG